MTHPQLTSYSKVKKAESFSSKIRNKTKDAHSCHFYSTLLEVPNNAIRQEKEIKGIQIRKKKNKTVTICR